MEERNTDSPTLSLIVLQSADIDAARSFYTLLGLSFVEEQHGRGPRHCSCTLDSIVFEIYPQRENRAATPLRIGFRVPALDLTLDVLRSRGVKFLREATDSPWGRRAVVEDPDGNCVELTSLN